ncbi:MAG: DUF2891 domain-containing protein [Planctomycetota bacterium]|nr:MAG: DUF2891 domain-containing protein [Planctomycetota bacterium]
MAAFARLALDGIGREFPNKPGNVMAGPEDVRAPRAMHPAFYGSFDWHSAVHGHWMLVRLLRAYPGSPIEAEARAALAEHLGAAELAAEAAYFEPKHNRSFERTYGWAWLLRLAQELRGWDDPQARVWAAHLRPLEERIVELTKAYLPKLSWPIRVGEHPNTAWALAEFLDYARAVGDRELAALAEERARAYYLGDRDYPVQYEPSGHDFFSPGLLEADLMRRVLPPEEFSAWLDRFLPGLRAGELGHLGTPVEVSDPTDGKLVHLAGLNLVRAWTQRGIAAALPADDPRRATLLAAAAAHAEAGLGYVFSGYYEGEHWLASFAVYLLTDAGIPG